MRGVGKTDDFQPISCRISETVRDRVSVNQLITNRKSHKRCQLPPASKQPWITLNGRTAEVVVVPVVVVIVVVVVVIVVVFVVVVIVSVLLLTGHTAI